MNALHRFIRLKFHFQSLRRYRSVNVGELCDKLVV